jgi:hypothetical protein
MGDWYWIGMLAGLGAGLGILFAGALAATRAGMVASAALGAGAGLLAGLGIGEWDEAIGGAIGGLLGAAGAAQLVQGTLRRGGTRGGTAMWIGLGALLVGALALVPGVGYLEAAVLPLIGARLRNRAPKRYAGLRSLAK